MSHPYIIWTMQRTGGTTLAMLLRRLSEHPSVEDEPFNLTRVFGHITNEFLEGGEEAKLTADLHPIFEQSYVIKHCYELKPEAVNRAVIQVASKMGYRHIILDRRSERDRIISLELAAATGAWGRARAKEIFAEILDGTKPAPILDQKHATDYLAYSQQRREELAQQMSVAGETPFVVFFEDIYNQPAEVGNALLLRLLTFLDIDPADHSGYDKLVNDVLFNRGQKTSSVLEKVQNIEELRAKLDTLSNGFDKVFIPS